MTVLLLCRSKNEHRTKSEHQVLFKLGKTFTETHQMMKKVYSDDCLSRSRIHEGSKRFQEGREDLEDDERSGRPRNVVNEENAEIVREFIRKEPKSSLKYMESELGISAESTYRILTENLRYIKVCAKFVPLTLKPQEKTSEFNIQETSLKRQKRIEWYMYWLRG